MRDTVPSSTARIGIVDDDPETCTALAEHVRAHTAYQLIAYA